MGKDFNKNKNTITIVALLLEDNYNYLLAYISDKVKDVRGYGDKYNSDLALLLDG